MNKEPDSMNCNIKRKAGTYNCYTMTFKGLTRGSILAMQHALEGSESPVAKDVLAFINNAVDFSGDSELIDNCKR